MLLPTPVSMVAALCLNLQEDKALSMLLSKTQWQPAAMVNFKLFSLHLGCNTEVKIVIIKR